jgi:hypothetical protein
MSKSKDANNDICPVSLSDDSDCLIIDEDRCFEDPGDYVVAASALVQLSEKEVLLSSTKLDKDVSKQAIVPVSLKKNYVGSYIVNINHFYRLIIPFPQPSLRKISERGCHL